MLKTAEQIADDVLQKIAFKWPWEPPSFEKKKTQETPNSFNRGADVLKEQRKPTGVNLRQARLDSIARY